VLTITIIRNIDEVELDLLKCEKNSTLYKGIHLIEKTGKETPLSKFNLINTKFILDLRIIDPNNYIKPTSTNSHPYKLFIYEIGDVVKHEKRIGNSFEKFTFIFFNCINI
jgi:hypothetical protein